MNNRVIGRIVTISQNNIIAEISNDVGSYVSIYDGIRFVGEIGSYVAIDDLGRKIIAEIVAVDEKNELSSDKLNKAGSKRYLRIGLIGEIVNKTFNFGVTKMPPIFSEIRIITKSDLQLMLDITDEFETNIITGENMPKTLNIGTSVMFPDYQVKVKLNEFFGFHFAIFGNTGAGKSNTVARIIQAVFHNIEYPATGAKFIIFDSNGEYKSAFENVTQKNPLVKAKFFSTCEDEDEKIKIPVWALSVDDWAILLHASEKTQVPIISRALELIQVFDSSGNDSDKELIIKNHIIATVIRDVLSGADSVANKSDKVKVVVNNFSTDNFKYGTVINNNGQQITLGQAIQVSYGEMKLANFLVEYCEHFIQPNVNDLIENKHTTPYSLQRFEEAIRLAILYEGSVNSARIHEYTATLVTRLKHIIESEQGEFFAETKFTSVQDYVEDIIGENQLLNIDISSLDDVATEVITKVFSKLLFDYMRNLKPRNSMPINLILEEAHRFVRSDMDYGVLGYNIFERIAKEGRKYGLLMGISSQRPSELSKTVVSQCSNFIIHKIQNPDDINYISRMVPYVNQGIIDRITYLRRGYALVFGTAINLPTLTTFEKADPTPNSGNSDIVWKWYSKHQSPEQTKNEVTT